MARLIICAKCERERPIKARGLCAPCYQVLLEWDPERLADYPTRRRDPSMDVDEVAVDRAVEWVLAAWNMPPAQRERFPHRLTLGGYISPPRRQAWVEQQHGPLTRLGPRHHRPPPTPTPPREDPMRSWTLSRSTPTPPAGTAGTARPPTAR